MRHFLLISLWLLVHLHLIGTTSASPRLKRHFRPGKSLVTKQKLEKLLSGANLNIGLREDYLLQDCGGNELKQSFPDLDYSLFGYNVFKGYPLADGHDPGFTLPIFAADYTGSKHTADCRYSVPKGFVVVPDVSCDISFSSKVTQTAYQFVSELKASAKVSGGGWGASFSASAEYNKANAELSSGETVYIISSASCTQYFSKLIPRASPEFNPLFSWWLNRLSSTNDTQVYFQFFETYGTHFPTMVTYGARFSHQYKMTSQTYQNKTDEGVNVAVEASYSGLFSIGGGFGLDSSQRQQASDFQKSVETKTVTVGASPPSNGDAMTWASTVKNNPVPVKYELESIENVFNYLKPNSFPNTINLTNNIRNYKELYCEELVRRGSISTCKIHKAGLELKGTRLIHEHRAIGQTTFDSCVEQCLALNPCLAITYCDDCKEGDGEHLVCYMYGKMTKRIFTAAEAQVGWKSYIILDKITSHFRIMGASIIGTPMIPKPSMSPKSPMSPKSENATEETCQKQCEDNILCVAFVTPKTGECFMYEESLIKGIITDHELGITFVG